jgi:type IV secretion system protein VirB6
VSVAACPALEDQPLGVVHALASVDCRVGLVVTSSYGRLFGEHGVFGTVLTVVLTLYVAFIALGLMTGRTRLTLSGLAPKVLAIGLVLTFATSWPAYQTVIYGLLVGGPEQIATALAGSNGNAVHFAVRLDDLLTRFADVTKALGDSAPGASKALGPLAGPQMASALVWVSGMLILLGSAGALVLTRIVLALLLAVGPVFVVLALFRQTRGLFEGWFRTALLFAIAPTLTVLVGTGAVAALSPLVDKIADNPAAAVNDLQPILELFMGSVVFVALIGMLTWTSASLVRGWRFGTAREEGGVGASAFSVAAASAADISVTGGSRASAPPADPRVGQVVTSLARDGAGSAPVSVRVEQASAVSRADLPASAGAGVGIGPQRRTEGLGQGFRAPVRPARLSGAPS